MFLSTCFVRATRPVRSDPDLRDYFLRVSPGNVYYIILDIDAILLRAVTSLTLLRNQGSRENSQQGNRQPVTLFNVDTSLKTIQYFTQGELKCSCIYVPSW